MVNSPAPPTVTLRSALDTVFPTPGGEGSSSGSKRDLDVCVIPQGIEPRWIILGSPREALPVLQSWAPFNLRSRLQWAGVRSAASLNLLARLPGVVVDRVTLNLSYWEHRLSEFGEEWVPVVHVGNPSHTRKIIVFFVGRDGRFRAVGKAPLASEAGKAILNEFQVLESLRGMLSVPKPLFQDTERGMAAQEWLDGKPVSRRLVPEHIDFLVSLAQGGGTVRLSAWRPELEKQVAGLDPSLDRDRIHRALDQMDFDVPLPAVVEHRDFAPWNLKRLADGKTGAIDWEWGTLEGLPCQDIFRWFFIQDALFNGPGAVWSALLADPLVRDYQRRVGLPQGAMRPLALFYLLRVMTMDSESSNLKLVQHSFRQIDDILAATV